MRPDKAADEPRDSLNAGNLGFMSYVNGDGQDEDGLLYRARQDVKVVASLNYYFGWKVGYRNAVLSQLQRGILDAEDQGSDYPLLEAYRSAFLYRCSNVFAAPTDVVDVLAATLLDVRNEGVKVRRLDQENMARTLESMREQLDVKEAKIVAQRQALQENDSTIKQQAEVIQAKEQVISRQQDEIERLQAKLAEANALNKSLKLENESLETALSEKNRVNARLADKLQQLKAHNHDLSGTVAKQGAFIQQLGSQLEAERIAKQDLVKMLESMQATNMHLLEQNKLMEAMVAVSQWKQSAKACVRRSSVSACSVESAVSSHGLGLQARMSWPADV